MISRIIRLAAAAAVALVLVVAVAACGGDDDEGSASTAAADTTSGSEAKSEEAPKIALFAPLKNSYVAAVQDVATKTAESLGGSVETFDANFDAQKQASQIQDAIASQKYNGFIVYPLDAAGVVPMVQQALDADIQVAVETTPVGPKDDTADIQVEGIAASSANPPYLDGKSMAEAIKEACAGKDPCNVLHIAGDFAFYYDVGFLKGIKDGLKGSNAKLVNTLKGEYQADPAYNATRDALQANKDVDVITSSSDVMIGGAERAVNDVGLKADPKAGVALIGNGGSEVAFKGVKDGTWWGSVVWLPEISAKRNVEGIAGALNGQPLDPPGIYTSELSDIGLFLKPDNVDQFKPQWAGN